MICSLPEQGSSQPDACSREGPSAAKEEEMSEQGHLYVLVVSMAISLLINVKQAIPGRKIGRA